MKTDLSETAAFLSQNSYSLKKENSYKDSSSEDSIIMVDPDLIRRNRLNFFHIDQNIDVPALAQQILASNYIAPGVVYESAVDENGVKDGCLYTLLGGETRLYALRLINDERRNDPDADLLQFPVRVIEKPQNDNDEIHYIIADNSSRVLSREDKAYICYHLNEVYEYYLDEDARVMEQIRNAENKKDFDEADRLRKTLHNVKFYKDENGNRVDLRRDDWIAMQINRTKSFKASTRVVTRYKKYARQLLDLEKEENTVTSPVHQLSVNPKGLAILLRKITGIKTRVNKDSVLLDLSSFEDFQKIYSMLKTTGISSDEADAVQAFDEFKKWIETADNSKSDLGGEKNGPKN